MRFERAFIVVLVITQTVTGYFVYQQSEAVSSVSAVFSNSHFGVDKRIQALEEEVGIQRNHHHGKDDTASLSERLDRLAQQSRNSDFSILGSFDDVDKTVAKLEERITFVELALDPLDYRVSMIDCGETRVNVTRAKDHNVCRWKR